MAGDGKIPPPEEPPLPAYALRLEGAGRHAEAEEAYAAFVAAHPGDARALKRAGVAALNAGRVAIAIRRFEQLAALDPESAEARCALGDAFIRAGRPADAIFHLERAVELDPRRADAHYRLGLAFERAGDRTNAIRSHERALALEPRHANAAASLGHVRNRRGDTARSREAFARALAFDPEHLAARTGLAFADAIDGDLDGARAALEAMASGRPDEGAFWSALGKVRAWAGALGPAEEAYRQAAACDPSDVDARVGVAVSLLGQGRYADGFLALENRPDGRFGETRRFARFPVWSGARLEGPLLVHCEGSLSDTIQFARFLPDLKARVPEVALVVDDYWTPLAPLLATVEGVDHLLEDPARADALRTLPAARAGIQSLPFHFGLTPANLPGRAKYLSAPRDRADVWRARIDAIRAPRVGLVWNTRGDLGALSRHKSVPPQALAPLLATPGVAFVSLQVGAMGDLTRFGDLAPRVVDFSSDIGDFGDTAAIVAALDLVISVDTSVAHVAGAMGKPVWLLDRYHTSWRWRLAAGRSPWYPSLRIFRQHRFLDWSHPILAVAAALRAFAAGRTLPP
jgi:tetratricopeptide (TPR) repeat protein